jgi:hypothetical protein
MSDCAGTSAHFDASRHRRLQDTWPDFRGGKPERGGYDDPLKSCMYSGL